MPFKKILSKLKTACDSLRKSPWTVITFLVISLVAVILFVMIPLWQRTVTDLTNPKERIDAQTELVRTVAQVVGGAILLIGVYATLRRVAATERTVSVAQEGQITERFTKAIEQLDSSKPMEVRLGGIYALERIARDSQKDHWTIMEVLTAYVREHALWIESDEYEEEIPPLPTDIQAILTVMGRRSWRKTETERLDLQGTNLRKANLYGAHMEKVDFANAHLEQANLLRAHLEEAILWKAYMEGAILDEVYLNRTILIEAHLKDASLNRAHIQEADLSRAHLENTPLFQARLEKARLIGSHMDKVNLYQAHLEGTDLRGATGLTQEDISYAIIDSTTKLPKSFLSERKPDDG